MKYIEIRDSVYDDIKLTELEKAVIDTPEFQRLRRVTQLPIIQWVFPDAVHTRFSQSLGTMKVAAKILDNIYGHDKDPKIDWLKKYTRLAALLYDINDPPYYTVFNEDIENETVLKNVLKKIRREKIKSICDTVKENYKGDDISSEDLTKIFESDVDGEHKLSRQIIDSEIGADRIDYLVRDSKFCGVNYSQVDPRIFSMFKVNGNELVLDREAIPLVDAIFHSLFTMKYNIYDHKVARSITRMIYETYKSFLKTKKRGKEKLLRQLAECDDNEFLGLLRKFEENRKDKYVTNLVSRREILKTAYQLEGPALKDIELVKALESLRQHRKDLEACMAEEYKTKIFLDFVPLKPSPSVSLKVKISETCFLPLSDSPLLSQWYDRSKRLGYGERALAQWKMFVFSEEKDRDNTICAAKEIFDVFLPGEHDYPKNPVRHMKPIYEIAKKVHAHDAVEDYKKQISELSLSKRSTLINLAKLDRASTSGEIAVLTDRTSSAENMYLDALQKIGLVSREKAGHSYKYTLPYSVKTAVAELGF